MINYLNNEFNLILRSTSFFEFSYIFVIFITKIILMSFYNFQKIRNYIIIFLKKTIEIKEIDKFSK